MTEKKNIRNGSVRRDRLLPISILLILFGTMVPGMGHFEIQLPHLDKVAHFALFFFFSINICFRYQSDRRLEVMLWAIFFGLMTEVIQQFIPGRDMDLYDGIADVFGVIMGFYAYKHFQKQLDKILLMFGA